MSGVWIGTSPWVAAVWVVVVAIAYVGRVLNPSTPATQPPSAADGLRTRPTWLLAAFASLPVLVYLAATWLQEFPYTGDQVFHNGYALEAYHFWWPWWWIAAVAAIVWVVRWASPRAALIAIAALPVIGALFPPRGFAASYPGMLHFFSAPLHALGTVHPLNIERVLNALSIPAWLLVLRPMFVRRAPTIGTFAIAAHLFWQKDVVYYFGSGYLEPWAFVLTLTALEHLVRFDGEEIWQPLLLLGTAGVIKEQMIVSLPVVAAVYFPRRERLCHVLIMLTALAPFTLFFVQRAVFKGVRSLAPTTDVLNAATFAAAGHRIAIQFGPALVIVVAGLVALVVLARRRPYAALLLVALANAGYLYVASAQRAWGGYPRTNFVPMICIALGIGAVLERLPRKLALPAAAVILACNVIPLLPMMRTAFGPDVARNFFEADGAPIYYPIREAIGRAEQAGLIRPGDEIHLLHNGKRIFDRFYPGPIEEQYPDLARRYRMKVMSFRDDVPRCRCGPSGAAQVELIIAFHNLGIDNPQRPGIEVETEQCRAAILSTCRRVITLDQAVIGQ